jgi:hypothetical protein
MFQHANPNAMFVIALATLIDGIRAQVSLVTMSLAAADAIAFKTNAAPVTFSFTSARVLPAGQGITISLPASYFVDRANPAVSVVNVNPVQGAVAPTATCALVVAPQCTITCLTAGSALDAAAHRLVFGAGQLSTGAARAVQATGLAISTSFDSVAFAASTAIFTHFIIFQNDFDRVSQKRTSGSVNVTFFLGLTLPAGGRITIHLPHRYFSASPEPVASVFCIGLAPIVTCALSALSITCTTSVRNLESGFVTLRFLPGTLTTGNSRNETNDSFKIEISEQAATVVSAASVTPAIAAGRVRLRGPDLIEHSAHE